MSALPPDEKTEQDPAAAELVRLQAMLQRIDEKRAQVIGRIEELRRVIADREATRVEREKQCARGKDVRPVASFTSEAKVRLFRGLFRGREDVFPRRWENRKKNTSGYSPACSNEWVPGICDKPRVKCGDCAQRAFTPVDDRVVLDHLRGRHVMGVYPMLPDDSCCFLAIDFDKSSWREDVTAVVEAAPWACRRRSNGPGPAMAATSGSSSLLRCRLRARGAWARF